MSNILNRNVWCVDIETLAGLFTYTSFNIDTKEVVQYIIHKDKSELIQLIKHLKECKGHITFNGNNFDYPIIHFILLNWNKWIDIYDEEYIIKLIYDKAQEIIESQNQNIGKKVYVSIPNKEVLISQLDLFKIWHFDNKAKLTGLKWIQFSIDYLNLEEMSIHHSTKDISLNQIKEIKSYNLNDVMSTYELYKITIGETEHSLYKGIDKIQLRKDIIEEFKIKCLNYNDVKIGDEINKHIYSKLSNISKYELPKKGTFRSKIKVIDCVKIFPNFQSLELQSFYNEFCKIEFNPQKVKEEKGSIFTFKNLKISFNFGGIHTVDLPRKIISDKEYYLTDKDCIGMY